MNLTDEQLALVEEMSEALMPPKDIAILIGLPANEIDSFVEQCNTHVNSTLYMAFQKGRLKTKLELQKTIIKLAKHGSPAAEPIAEKFIREQLM